MSAEIATVMEDDLNELEDTMTIEIQMDGKDRCPLVNG